jgi:hypothetical protein
MKDFFATVYGNQIAALTVIGILLRIGTSSAQTLDQQERCLEEA